jgi:hypothetical protein
MAVSTKIFVAVHGIGDQIGYETVLSVAGQVAGYYGIAQSLPVGRFYPAALPKDADLRPMPVLMSTPPDPGALVGFGFGEVYWAGIARRPAKDGFVLEETKKWARTISGRVALRAMAIQGEDGALPEREQLRLVTVLDELIETVFIFERLCYLAEKAGFFKFNLRALLSDFVGDVQLVADFGAYRSTILNEFNSVMNAAAKLAPPTAGSAIASDEPNDPLVWPTTIGRPASNSTTASNVSNDLYIVAHSEGSVLAFLALLTALSDPTKDEHAWIRSVKGVMTIGSPIEVHHLLWPELWQRVPGPDQLSPHAGAPVIAWRNYLDHGDPIAYTLTQTIGWMHANGFDRHLKLEQHPFSRSYLPGKAHTDYWNDEAVFGHFIETVVKPEARGSKGDKAFQDAPRNKLTAQIASWVIPYAAIVALLLAATYSLHRGVAAILRPDGLSAASVLRDVVGIGLLLFGMTVAGRLPRLTAEWKYWALSAVVFVLSMASYSNVACPDSQRALGLAFSHMGGGSAADLEGIPLRLPADWSLPPCRSDRYAVPPGQPEPEGKAAWLAETRNATRGLLTLAAVLALVAGITSSWWPSGGVRILPGIGAVAAVLLVVKLLWETQAHPQALSQLAGAAPPSQGGADPTKLEWWPVVLGVVGFFYLWWLATLLFDLVFVWHRYIRNEGATQSVSRLWREGYKRTRAERLVDHKPAPPAAGTTAH